jgi:nitroreductase
LNLNLSADELLTTTRAVRKRLDFNRRVERATVEECLNIALQAPTSFHRQPWHWVVVEDVAVRRRIADIYRANFTPDGNQVDHDINLPAVDLPDDDARGARLSNVRRSAVYLAENLHRVPLLMIPCHWGRLDNAPIVVGASGWGSLLPAVWSFMLALRERGLGSAWTTLHLMNDGERQVADLLGIPFEKVCQGGLFPIAHTIGTDFRPANREPLRRSLHWDRW